MFLKRFFGCTASLVVLFSSVSTFAWIVSDEDKETICNAVESLAKRTSLERTCPFICANRELGRPLLKEGLKYALDLKKYSLAEKIMDLIVGYGLIVNMDINEVEMLDYYVVKTGNKNLYKKLINAGYKMSTPTSGNNLLYAAVKSENLKLVDKFLSQGFDPNDSGPWGVDDDLCGGFYTPLIYCLEKIQDISNEYNFYGFQYPENRKRVENLIEIVKTLCSHGADTTYEGNKCVGSVFYYLEALNPDNKENCYEKFEYYNKDTIEFCRKIYNDLRIALNL
ncbi:MAG: hypothetical protein IJI84_02520 [Clostridia bacterium]|nr:hypothetical protein [Clostridia bacterium]